MKLVENSNFDSFYDELNKINEEQNAGPSISFKDIYASIKNNKNLSPEQWAAVEDISRKIAHVFKTENSEAAALAWTRQFQFMYNAWVTESKAKELLNDGSFVKSFNDYIDKLKETLDKKYHPYLKHLSGSYDFHHYPNDHYNYQCERTTEANKSTYDIESKTPNDEIYSFIEVKATNDPNSSKLFAKAFHKSDLVFIFDIANNKLYFKFRSKKTHYYEWLSKDPAKPEAFMDIDIKKDCISVLAKNMAEPKIEYSVTEFTPYAIKDKEPK